MSYNPSVQTVETKSTSIVESSILEDNSVPVQIAGVKLITVVRLSADHSTAIPVKMKELC